MVKTIYAPNLQTIQHSFYPFDTRPSANQRILRHSLQFSFLSSIMSFGYHSIQMTRWETRSLIMKGFALKTFVSFTFFYTNEVLWGYFNHEKIIKQQNQLRIPSWKTSLATALIVFPINLAITGLGFRNIKAWKKSFVDVFAMCFFSQFFELLLRKKRERLLSEGCNSGSRSQVVTKASQQKLDQI